LEPALTIIPMDVEWAICRGRFQTCPLIVKTHTFGGLSGSMVMGFDGVCMQGGFGTRPYVFALCGTL
jgi:hypothetical protein